MRDHATRRSSLVHAPHRRGAAEPGPRRRASDCGHRAAPSQPIRLLLAGGGTGGHLYPGLAVAKELRRLRPGTQVVLAGTGRPAETRALERLPIGHALLGARPFPRRLGALPGFAWALAGSIRRGIRLVRRFDPDLVVGLGGYSSAPPAIAARLAGRPVYLLEQNVVPGLANRWLSRLATEVLASFEESARHFPAQARVTAVGNPVRGEVTAPRIHPRRELGLDETRTTLLVIGGSQGARGLNEAVLRMMPQLGQRREEIQVIHLSGEADARRLARAYDEAGVAACVRAFERDMATVYQAADLALARAGGTTIAELRACGLPSVLVPFPHAAEDHQRRNAEAVARAGGAVVLEEEDLGNGHLHSLLTLLDDPACRARLAAGMRAQARPEAATRVARRLLAEVELHRASQGVHPGAGASRKMTRGAAEAPRPCNQSPDPAEEGRHERHPA